MNCLTNRVEGAGVGPATAAISSKCVGKVYLFHLSFLTWLFLVA